MENRLEYLPSQEQSSISSDSAVNRDRYSRTIQHLEKYKFWNGRDNILGLWEHQKSAIAHGVAYLNADRSLNERQEGEGGVTEAALFKLPTGTGKSGIIAVLTRCIPEAKRALVLTPRAAITDQLMQDIQHRFWSHMRFDVEKSVTWTEKADVAGAEISDVNVELLLPNIGRLNRLLTSRGSERSVIVGTLQGFDSLWRSRDKLQRKAQSGATLTDADDRYLKSSSEVLEFLLTFELVVIDEGHYEPAPSWSRSVRYLDRPTLLFSATPFRNDYKLFRVHGRFVFNIPYQVVRDRNVVRDVKFCTDDTLLQPAPLREGRQHLIRQTAGVEETSHSVEVTQQDLDDVTRFGTLLKKQLTQILVEAKKYTETPKVIVRGASYESLVLIQKSIKKELGENAVLVHERVQKSDESQRHYQTVEKAIKHFPSAKFWLHETKLLEGIDDPNIVAVAIYDHFTNERQLVQQIGRAIRSTDKTRVQPQTAYVVAIPEMRDQIERSWRRYLEYEEHCAQGLDNVVPSEANLPEKIVQHIPKMQYVNGQFRHRLPSDLIISMDDIVLPLSTSAFTVSDHFDLESAKEEAIEAILASDRFVVREIKGLPQNTFGWTFFGVRESPYLADHFMTEWGIGVFLAAHVENFLFVQDTDGIVFEPHKLEVARLDRERLLKLFPEMADQNSAITRMSALSLDMSDRAIRSIATRTRSFADTFTDLLDSVLVPTAVSGFVNNNNRYVGIQRARISDASSDYLSLSNYLNWVNRIAVELTDNSSRPSHVFDRYANMAKLEVGDTNRPTNILLDLTHDTLTEYGVIDEVDGAGAMQGQLNYQDFCVEIDKNGEFSLTSLDGVEISCSIKFSPKTSRYRLISHTLNERHPPKQREQGGRAITLTERINRDQAFRLTIPKEGVVYMQGEFHQSGDFVTTDGIVIPLEDTYAVPLLRETVSEKGEGFFDDEVCWQARSVFGAFNRACRGGDTTDFGKLWEHLQHHHLVVLDDGGDEIADFIAVGDRRITLVHAKASKSIHHESITELQVVGRQVSASLAFCSSRARVESIADDRFDRKYIANDRTLDLSRVFRNSNNISDGMIARHIRLAMMNPAYQKEVWIVAGRLIDLEGVRKRAVARKLSNRQRQLLMFIESLRTTCGRANAKLRIFGHTSEPVSEDAQG